MSTFTWLFLACTGPSRPNPNLTDKQGQGDTAPDTDGVVDTDTRSETDTLTETDSPLDTDTDTVSSDTGYWVVPSPPECDVLDVPSINPGPVVSASDMYLLRVDGEKKSHCHFGLGLGDNDGDGQDEFALSCWGDSTPSSHRGEAWIFDGHGSGLLGRNDAATVVVGRTRSDGTYLAVGELTRPGKRDLVFSGQTQYQHETHVIQLPAPLGFVDATAVSAASIPPVSYTFGAVSVGDYTGDGQDDLSVNGNVPPLTYYFPSYAYSFYPQGGVSIYPGPLSGVLDPLADAYASFEASEVDEWLPDIQRISGLYSPALVGDTSPDGHADVLMGGEMMMDFAPNYLGYFDNHQGMVYYSDAAGGTHSAFDAQAILYGTCYALFGEPQSPVGDVTGDGLPDAAAGGFNLTVGGLTHRGGVFVLSKLSTAFGYQSVADVSGAIILGEGIGDLLGDVGYLGDLNQDGVDDLVVGARFAGRVYLFLGPVSGTIHAADADLIIQADAIEDGTFGSRVSGIGDIDGDGVVDLMVASITASWGGNEAGAVWIFSGAALLAEM